jgi:hypothetical protein
MNLHDGRRYLEPFVKAAKLKELWICRDRVMAGES